MEQEAHAALRTQKREYGGWRYDIALCIHHLHFRGADSVDACLPQFIFPLRGGDDERPDTLGTEYSPVRSSTPLALTITASGCSGFPSTAWR